MHPVPIHPRLAPRLPIQQAPRDIPVFFDSLSRQRESRGSIYPQPGARGQDSQFGSPNLFRNHFHGYDLGPGSSVINSSACQNRDNGFHLRAGSVVAHCTSRMNRRFGYLAESEDPIDVFDPFANPRLTPEATSFQHCAASRNFGDGFRATVNSTFTHCTADAIEPGPGYRTAAKADGFEIIDSCRLVNCMASNNTDAGIRGLEDNYLEQNTVHTNGSAGIDLGSAANTVIKNYLKFNPIDFMVGGAPAPGGGVGGIAPVVLPSAPPPLNPFGNFAF